MSHSEPRYLLAPPGTLPDEIRTRLEELGPLFRIESLRALSVPEIEPGWILVPARVGAAMVTALLEQLGGMPGAWSPLLVVEEPDGEITVLPVSPGFRVGLDEVRGRLDRTDAGDAVLSFRKAMPVLSRVRHDINNALTAAFAEVQLLLMDSASGTEQEKALRTVESQLRRVRDLVAELSPIRAPGR